MSDGGSKSFGSHLPVPERENAVSFGSNEPPSPQGHASALKRRGTHHALARSKTQTRPCNLHFDSETLEWLENEEAETSKLAEEEDGCLADDIEEVFSDLRVGTRESQRDTWRFYSLIYVMAVLTCVLSFVNDVFIEFGFNVRGTLLWAVVHRLESAPPLVLEAASMLVWVGYEVVMVAIAHACARRHPMSYGSGIPEIHCELQGTHMKGFLAPGILKAKALGLLFAQVSGLPIGKEGPFVHCAAAMTRFLAHRPLFSGALRVPGCLRQLMVISVAVGTCSTVGVPIGGVLFALEVMPDAVWENISYWMSIGTATVGGMTLYLLKLIFKGIIVSLVPRLPDEVEEARLFKDPILENCYLLALSAALGMVCGVMGGLFVRSQIGVATWLRGFLSGRAHAPSSGRGFGTTSPKAATPKAVISKHHTMMMQLDEPLVDHARTWDSAAAERRFRVAGWRQTSGGSPRHAAAKHVARTRAMLLCLLVAAMDGLVSFAVPAARGSSQPALLWKLVSSDKMNWHLVGSSTVPSLPHDALFGWVPEHLPLCLFLAVKWVLTVLVLSLPLPSGCIIPSYIIGALLGRAFSYGVQSVAQQLVTTELRKWLYIHVQFSFIGATAFTCAVCHSFSVVVVMFELVNGTEDVLLRLGVAAIVAIYTANLISPSIFEASAAMKHLPQTPRCSTLLDGWDPVSNAMREEVAIVPEIFGPAPTGSELLEAALNKHPHDSDFAVLAGGPEIDSTACLLGSLPRAAVEAALFRPDAAFSRSDVNIATQVAPSMPVKNAQLALELLGQSELYVVDKGRLVGVVSFNDIVHYQRMTAGRL